MIRVFTAFSGYDSQCLALNVLTYMDIQYNANPKYVNHFYYELVGWSDIDKIQAAGISKSQQYKMAGNSIVVNTLAAIFRQLFIGNFNKVIQTEIF